MTAQGSISQKTQSTGESFAGTPKLLYHAGSILCQGAWTTWQDGIPCSELVHTRGDTPTAPPRTNHTAFSHWQWPAISKALDITRLNPLPSIH